MQNSSVVLWRFGLSSYTSSPLLPPWRSASSPQTHSPVELLPQQVPLFADSLQHGAILLSPTHQVRERVVQGAVRHRLVHSITLFSWRDEEVNSVSPKEKKIYG